MADIVAFLYLPFLAGLVLTGIHVYLGMHVVERRTIVAALSLAQLAALGTALAVVSGLDPHSAATHVWSFGFTVIGAAVFVLTRDHRETRVPREAIVGTVYAVSAAGAILAMSNAPDATERIQDMLVGGILSVNAFTVLKTALLYALVGLFHFIFRKKFLAISIGTHNEQAETIPNVKLWDFLFYVSVGLVVTSSVAIAGVLLVFSYLIVPSVAATLFSRNIGTRLAIGWTMGAVVSCIGVLLSFKLDLPTGATIVCTFGIALALMAIVRAITKRRALPA